MGALTRAARTSRPTLSTFMSGQALQAFGDLAWPAGRRQARGDEAREVGGADACAATHLTGFRSVRHARPEQLFGCVETGNLSGIATRIAGCAYDTGVARGKRDRTARRRRRDEDHALSHCLRNGAGQDWPILGEPEAEVNEPRMLRHGPSHGGSDSSGRAAALLVQDLGDQQLGNRILRLVRARRPDDAGHRRAMTGRILDWPTCGNGTPGIHEPPHRRRSGFRSIDRSQPTVDDRDTPQRLTHEHDQPFR